jgi:hypothetical protein
MGLSQQRNDLNGLTTSFNGGLDMANIFLPAVQRYVDIAMIAEGTVSIPQPQPDSPAQFGAIGITSQPQSAEPGVISILIGVLLPAVQNQVPAVQGNVRLYSSFADVYTEIVTGVSTAFSEGSFSAQYRPGG